jgi:hypothetical protein
MFGLSSNPVTFPKAYMSDMTDISALLGSISGIANLHKRPPRSPLSGRFAPPCSTIF